jgi:hypothetical protein
VHWTSDIIAALALAVLGIAVAERYVVRPDCECSRRGSEMHDVDAQTVDGPVLEATA